MKAKNILAALLLMVSTNMMADKYLTITYSGLEQNIAQRITFEGGYVVVTTTEGTHSYPISVLDKMTFTESADAIKTMAEQTENMAWKDGTLSVRGDGMLRIYNMAGALISIANVKEGANISLDNLPSGVYIVRMGDKAIKLRK